MTAEEFADAKSLWKFFYAAECFKHVENACSFILHTGMHENHPAYFSLITAIYVLYGKPFKRSKAVGMLPKEIVPAKFRELHNLMIMHRDQLYAHTDAHNFDDSCPGVPNQVRVRRVSSTEARLIGTEFYARPPLLPNVIALCQEMRNKTEYHIDKLQKRHFKKHLPKQLGEYPINVFDLAGPFFLAKQPPLEHR